MAEESGKERKDSRGRDCGAGVDGAGRVWDAVGEAGRGRVRLQRPSGRRGVVDKSSEAASGWKGAF